MKNPNVFQCRNKKEYTLEAACNYEYDCLDGEDEDIQMCKNEIRKDCKDFRSDFSKNFFQSKIFFSHLIFY